MKVDEVRELLKEIEELEDAIKFLLNFAPQEEEVPKGLNPMFYKTCTYEGDVELQQRVNEIRERVGIYYSEDEDNGSSK